MTKKRESGIELLRIIAIVQVIILHTYSYASVGNAALEINQAASGFASLFWSFCRTPVNVFILITGYFLVTSAFDLKKNIRRATKTYSAMLFYSIIISLGFFIAAPALFTEKPANFFRAFLPFFSREWYFLTDYIIILLLSPVINAAITKIDKKTYLWLLGILFVVLSVWPTAAEMAPFNQVISVTKIVDTEFGKSLFSFLFMYILGGFIRRFTSPKNKPQIKYLLAFAGLCILDFSVDLLLHNHPSVYSDVYGMFNNPLVVIESAMLFLYFRDMRFQNKWINLLGGTTLGVYAIHEHHLFRTWIWNIFNFEKNGFIVPELFILQIVITCVGLFLVLAFFEILRQKLFQFIEHFYHSRKQKAASKIIE